ncbi:MAG: hypothetical protein Q4A05_04090 [Ruminococcus sp.]|nr:hypothetical protein [Ruminococcus sp.]
MKLFFDIILPLSFAALLAAGLVLYFIRRPKKGAKLLVIALAAVTVYCIVGYIHYTH